MEIETSKRHAAGFTSVVGHENGNLLLYVQLLRVCFFIFQPSDRRKHSHSVSSFIFNSRGGMLIKTTAAVLSGAGEASSWHRKSNTKI